MNIHWDREPEKVEQKILADYLYGHRMILEKVIELSSTNTLLTTSATHKSLRSGFFTHDVREEQSSNNCISVAWRGIRTGDARPLLYGWLEQE
ncbi:hypothetical protein JXA12_03145 [Candidatus Woesearchaeota archaeon]|nr:hypothetical protein [Candidatus Woesearchaeota archaeon]